MMPGKVPVLNMRIVERFSSYADKIAKRLHKFKDNF
jgi:hypothetical protein